LPPLFIENFKLIPHRTVYTWTRDSALTTHGLLDVASSAQQAQVIAFLNDYITAQTALQKTSNPSGTLSDLSGLGEPKFNMDGTAFTGAWGRKVTSLRFYHAFGHRRRRVLSFFPRF